MWICFEGNRHDVVTTTLSRVWVTFAQVRVPGLVVRNVKCPEGCIHMCIKRDEEGDITYCTCRTQTVYWEARFEVRTAVFRQMMMLFCSETRFKEG